MLRAVWLVASHVACCLLRIGAFALRLRQDEPEVAYYCKWLLEAALVRVLRLQAADALAG